jgi:hypothetical protein|uniref:Ankyrin repeat domain-containing protein n=1 Tax=Eutreptiella gymnastica TaxID=73025 RepID=A0A7S4LN10_9EUGL
MGKGKKEKNLVTPAIQNTDEQLENVTAKWLKVLDCIVFGVTLAILIGGVWAGYEHVYRRLDWFDTDDSRHLWMLFDKKRFQEIKDFMAEDPDRATLRSGDGRGPMWWAYETCDEELVSWLEERYGLDPKTSDTDAKGLRPQDLCKRGLKKPRWRDSSQAAEVYNVLQGDANQIRQYFIANPSALQVRSEDGRGPLWWAWEQCKTHPELLTLLHSLGADVATTEQDAKGFAPSVLCPSKIRKQMLASLSRK